MWSSDRTATAVYHPTALAVDGHGYLYVLDAGHARIQVFDGDGRLVTMWGS